MGNTPLVTAAHFGHGDTVAALLGLRAANRLRSLSSTQRIATRSVATGPEEDEFTLYAEPPPEAATPLEAAQAQREIFQQLANDNDPSVLEQLTTYDTIIKLLHAEAPQNL